MKKIESWVSLGMVAMFMNLEKKLEETDIRYHNLEIDPKM